jgi:Holliday junction resolvasome RuvABC endonuclease subunit
MGIDCSTKSLAFGVFQNKQPLVCGEIHFEGDQLFKRLGDAQKKVGPLLDAGILNAEHVVFEGAVLVGKNARVGISLAYVYGAVIGKLLEAEMNVVTVEPLKWQTYIGNPNLKKEEREQLRKDNPGKSASWYQNAGRELRKQRTLAFSRKFFNIDSGSDNVGDAVAIAWYASQTLTEH